MGGASSRRSYASNDTNVAVSSSTDIDNKLIVGKGEESLAPGSITSLVLCESSLFAGFDSGYLAELDSSTLSLRSAWDAHNGRTVTRVAAAAGVVWSASRDSTVKSWRFGHGAATSASAACFGGELRGHTLAVTAVAASADGAIVATGGRDCTVRLWDAATRQETANVHISQNVVTCASFCDSGGSGETAEDHTNDADAAAAAAAAGGKILAQGGEDLRVRLWDTRTKGALRCVGEAGGYVYFPLALSVKGTLLATASKGFNGEGCEVREWDLRKDTMPILKRTLKGHAQDATGVVFLKNGLLASASKDGTVRLWQPRDYNNNNDSGASSALDVWASGGSSFTSLVVIKPSEKDGAQRIAVADTLGHISTLTIRASKIVRE